MPRKRNAPSRRDLLRLAGAGSLGGMLGSFPHVSVAQSSAAPPDTDETRHLEPLNRFPRVVQEYFVQHVRAIEDAGNQRRARLKTKADAEAYVRDVRARIQQCFGPWPEKTPLNPRITGVVERDAYNIEKLIFESRPEFLVTANLYVPKGRTFPLPAVVGTCGHSDNGKASELYQLFAQGLARMGYVVLLYDPLGQGERLQYVDEKLQPRIGIGTHEHLYAGNQQFLVGEFIGSWRAWDGIRALDYLLTRKEVDPRHLGVTGNSGGGTMTTWLCGVESRWTMAAPSCFVTTFRRNLENELSADTEQCPPHALALGLDHADFLLAMAPKPVLLMGKEMDYFDARGLEEAYRRVNDIYTLLGVPENVGLFLGPTYHGYTQENREAMYRWFNRATKVSDATKEPPLAIEKDETLQCTPHGQVAELGSKTVFSFTARKAKDVVADRPAPSGRALVDAVLNALGSLPSEARGPRMLKGDFGPNAMAPEFRILRPRSGRDYPTPYSLSYAVETEPGVFAIVHRLSNERLYSRPPRGAPRAILYIAHQSSDAELREEPLVRELLKAEPQSALFACDVRGVGDSRPDTGNADSFLNPYGSDYFYAIHAIMLDYPYVGQRTHDVLRVLAWLESYGHNEIHLAGKGWGALSATFAALLSGKVTQVTLKNALTSYQDVAESERYEWPLSSLLPNVLASFDLPDCYRALQNKKLRHIDPWGAAAGNTGQRS
jgi:cephalosporin-C deacetylase-like acetyl esterase